MKNADRLMTLSVVYDALMANPPRTAEAELMYHSVPGCETCPLPTAAQTGRATGVFYPAGKSGPRTKIYKAGLEEREERASATAFMAGSGRGTSGSAWVAVGRTDGGWPGAPEFRAKAVAS